MDIKGNHIRYTNGDMKNRLRVITTAEFISYLPLLAIRENYAAKIKIRAVICIFV
jgi:hypothetical protein